MYQAYVCSDCDDENAINIGWRRAEGDEGPERSPKSLVWAELDRSIPPILCGATRGPRGHVTCEKTLGHDIDTGQPGDVMSRQGSEHAGRGAIGQYFFWM